MSIFQELKIYILSLSTSLVDFPY